MQERLTSVSAMYAEQEKTAVTVEEAQKIELQRQSTVADLQAEIDAKKASMDAKMMAMATKLADSDFAITTFNEVMAASLKNFSETGERSADEANPELENIMNAELEASEKSAEVLKILKEKGFDFTDKAMNKQAQMMYTSLLHANLTAAYGSDEDIIKAMEKEEISGGLNVRGMQELFKVNQRSGVSSPEANKAANAEAGGEAKQDFLISKSGYVKLSAGDIAFNPSEAARGMAAPAGALAGKAMAQLAGATPNRGGGGSVKSQNFVFNISGGDPEKVKKAVLAALNEDKRREAEGIAR
jgi:hypothetical protein